MAAFATAAPDASLTWPLMAAVVSWLQPVPVTSRHRNNPNRIDVNLVFIATPSSLVFRKPQQAAWSTRCSRHPAPDLAQRLVQNGCQAVTGLFITDRTLYKFSHLSLPRELP